MNIIIECNVEYYYIEISYEENIVSAYYYCLTTISK